MKKIILIRHADSTDNQNIDHQRNLSQIGENQLPVLKENFSTINLCSNTHIYVSSSLRTQQTLTAIKDHPHANKIFIEQKLYLACKHTLLSKIQSQHHEINNIIIIGHNPGLSDLASYLTFKDHNCETGSITTLETDIETWTHCDAHEEFNVNYIPTNTI